MAEVTGTLEPTGPTITVRFEREVRATPEQVWAALTEPELLERWLAQAEFEPTVGGRVHLVWPDQGEMHGSITKLNAHEELEYSWNEATGSSLLQFEIEPAASGATLRLAHFGTSPEDAPGLGAGWQSHLEALDLVLAGTPSDRAARDARVEALKPAYHELLSG